MEIATPPILKGEPWSDIERLNKERELVGIYLSAHPLDEYKVILDNLCNTPCQEIDDTQKLATREDIVIGGIVTGIRQKYTKTGKPCGFVTLEDFDGSGVLALFGEDWGRFAGMFQEGASVYIVAKLQQRFRDSTLYDLKVQDVKYMQTVKDETLRKITISIDASKLDAQMVQELNELIAETPGKTSLYFQLLDSRSKKHVLLKSKSRTIDIRSRLINYIDQNEALDYKIN